MADGAVLDDAAHARALLGDEVRIDIHPGGVPAIIRARDPRLKSDLDAFVAWFAQNKSVFDRLAVAHGALLFRDFPVRGTEAFGRAIDHYPTNDLNYVGGASQRSGIAGRVMETTNAPKHWPFQMHQEMAYLPRYPRMIAFYCNVAPPAGGETLVADFRLLEHRLPRRFWDEVKTRGVRYARNFRAPGEIDPVRAKMHNTWTAAFQTEDAASAEAACRGVGLEPRWESDGSLTALFTAPGFTHHSLTGQTVWFNHIASQTQNLRNKGAEQWALYNLHYGAGDKPRPYFTTYGDGGEVDPEDVEDLQLTIEAITQSLRWEQGDILLIDNVLTAHGRAPFDGVRDIQVALLG